MKNPEPYQAGRPPLRDRLTRRRRPMIEDGRADQVEVVVVALATSKADTPRPPRHRKLS